MLSTFSHERLAAAHRASLERLARARDPRGSWAGALSSSPLATAAAISALVLAERNVDAAPADADPLNDSWMGGVLLRTELNELVGCGLRWLASQQNSDGGWGDAIPGGSNLAATMAVEAVFYLTGVPAKCCDMLQRARTYVDQHGGAATLRDMDGPRRTVTAGVLALYAAAGLIPWRKTPVRWTTIALAGAGRTRAASAGEMAHEIVRTSVALARAATVKKLHPLGGVASGAARVHALRFLDSAQADDGGFLDSPAITALALCSLASAGLADQPTVRRGVEFLFSRVRSDGSWAACVDVEVRETAAVLAATQWDRRLVGAEEAERALARLLAAQQSESGPRGGRRLLGWASTGRAGVASSVFDTAQALLALAAWRRQRPNVMTGEVRQAALAGLDWLMLALAPASSVFHAPLDWARRAGEWSGPRIDVGPSALALRALAAWRPLLKSAGGSPLDARLSAAIAGATRQLVAAQRDDGSWGPASAAEAEGEEAAQAVQATAAALTACLEAGSVDESVIRRGAQWLAAAQRSGGGWGPNPRPTGSYARRRDVVQEEADAARCTIEETAAAVIALAPLVDDPRCERAVALGTEWLAEAMLADARCEPAALSLAWTRLWYHDALAAPVAAAEALGQALSQSATVARRATHVVAG